MTVGSSTSAAAAAAAEAARRAAEEAARRAAEEARRRAEQARQKAEAAKRAAQAAQRQAQQQAAQARAAQRAAQKAPAGQKAQLQREAATQARQAERAEAKAQAAREEWAIKAKQAEDEMRAANTAAIEEGKRPFFSETQIRKVQPSSEVVADIYSDAGRRRTDFAEQLGIDPATDPNRVQAVLEGERQYAKLAQNPETAHLMRNYEITNGEQLHDFGLRVAREAIEGGGTREGDIPLSELKAGFPNDAVVKVLQGAGATVDGEAGKLLQDAEFGRALAEGRSAGRAAQIATGLSPAAREGMERMGVSADDYRKLPEEEQRQYLRAARLASGDKPDYEAAIGALGHAGPDAASAISKLAEDFDSAAMELLRSEDAVRAMLNTHGGANAVEALGADTEGATSTALQAMGGAVPREVIDQVADDPAIQEGLSEMNLRVEDLYKAGEALPELFDAARTDSSHDRIESLTAAIAANPRMEIKDGVVAAINKSAGGLEPSDTLSAAELKILSDKDMVTSLANAKNADALALFGQGELRGGLMQIKGKVPEQIFETVRTDETFVSQLQERTGIDAASLERMNGKAFGALANAAYMQLDDPPTGDQAQLLLGHMLDAAAANPAMRPQLSSSITQMTSEDGALADLPPSLKPYFEDGAMVRQLLGSREGTRALQSIATNNDTTEGAALALERLGEDAPDALVETVLEQNREELVALGFDRPEELLSSRAAIPDLLRAADQPGDSADNPDIDPSTADARLPHLLKAMAAAPNNAELVSVINDNAAAASTLSDSPAHYALLQDRAFVESLASNKQALTALTGDDPTAAFSAMKPGQLKGAVDVMSRSPEFNENLQAYGLTRADLLAADPAALPSLLEAASNDDALHGGPPDVLARAVAADPKLAPKLAPFLSENLPSPSTERDVFSDPKLVQKLASAPNGGEALAELMVGNDGNALQALGAKAPPELAGIAWKNNERELTSLGLDRSDFLQSGAAMGSLVRAVDPGLSATEQAEELSSALGHKPALAQKLAPRLSEIGAELDGAAGQILSDPKLVQKLATEKGGAQALAAIARGEWASGLTLIENKELRGQAVALAAKDAEFAEGMADLGITGEQLRTAGAGELTRLLNQAQAAQDVNELRQMQQDGASSDAIAEKLEQLVDGNTSPAYRSTLLERARPIVEAIAEDVTSEDTELSDDAIQTTMEHLSGVTEMLPEAQQEAMAKAFLDGADPEAIQDNDTFKEQFRHSIEQGGGMTFAVRVRDELVARGYEDEADDLSDQISDGMDEVISSFEGAQTKFNELQGQLEQISTLTDDPAAAKEQIEQFKNDHAEEFAEWEQASERMLSLMNGASLFTSQYDDSDLDGDADEVLDNADKALGMMSSAMQSEAGAEYMEDVVTQSASGGSTLLDHVAAVSEDVDGFRDVADKIASTAAGAMAVQMQRYADAGNLNGARQMADLVERHPTLFGLTGAQATDYKTTLLAATGDPAAIARAKSLPGFQDAQAALAAKGVKIPPGSSLDRMVASQMLAEQAPGQKALGGSLKAVGLVASGIGLTQGIANWDDASTTAKLATVWSGVELGNEGAGVLGTWATRLSEVASDASRLGQFAGKTGTALSGASKVLGKLGPVGAVLDAALSAQTAINQFQNGEVAQGIVTSVAGASSLGLAGLMLAGTVATGPGILIGIGIAAGAAIATSIIDSIEDGNSEDEVKDALQEQGINERLADIISNQTGDRVGIGAVVERIAKDANISTAELIEHWNEMPEDDARLGELETLVSGYTYSRTGEIPATMHSLIDDADGDASSISAADIHAITVRMQRAGLIPAA